MAFDSALERYATQTPAGEIAVRSTLDDRELARLPDTGRKVAALVRLSERLLPARYDDGTLHVWDIEARRAIFTGRCAQDFGGTGADTSPDERHLAIANGQREVIIHDLKSGAPIATHPTPMPAVMVRYSFDGRLLAVMTRGQPVIAVIEAVSGELVARLDHAPGPYAMAWQPDGERLAAAAADKRVHLWEAHTGRRVGEFVGHTEELINLDVGPQGGLLASVGFDGLRLWNVRTGETMLWTVNVGHISFAARGGRMARLDWGGGNFVLYELAAGSPVRYFGSKETEPDVANYGWQAAAFSPDGRWLAYASGGELRLFDGAKELARADTGFVTSLFFDAQRNLWMSGQRGCFRWPLRAGNERGHWTLGPPSRIGPDAPMQRAAVSHNGKVVAVCEGRTGHVFDAESGALISTLPGTTSAKVSVAVSPDGDLVATCVWNATFIRVWNSRDGSVRTNLALPQWKGGRSYADLAFSPDGRTLILAGLTDTTAWDTQEWKPRWTRSRADLASVTFSPDGSFAVMREAKRLAHLVAPDTGETLAALEWPGTDHVHRMSFSPDGMQLAVAGVVTRELVVWDLHGVRRELSALGLDWRRPPYPPEMPLPPLHSVTFVEAHWSRRASAPHPWSVRKPGTPRFRGTVCNPSALRADCSCDQWNQAKRRQSPNVFSGDRKRPVTFRGFS